MNNPIRYREEHCVLFWLWLDWKEKREQETRIKMMLTLLRIFKKKVLITADSPYGEYKSGDTGYIDGYLYGGDVPCAVVIIRGKFILIPISFLKLI